MPTEITLAHDSQDSCATSVFLRKPHVIISSPEETATQLLGAIYIHYAILLQYLHGLLLCYGTQPALL